MDSGTRKGVIFDTDVRGDVSRLKAMVKKRRISAYGDRRDAILGIGQGDIVFYSLVTGGLVTAARVTGDRAQDEDDERYWNVEFLTRVPTYYRAIPIMTFDKVSEATGKPFPRVWKEKIAYLDGDEAGSLLDALRLHLEGYAPGRKAVRRMKKRFDPLRRARACTPLASSIEPLGQCQDLQYALQFGRTDGDPSPRPPTATPFQLSIRPSKEGGPE